MFSSTGPLVLDEVGNVHWHLLDGSGVELLNLTEHADVVGSDKVDGNTLSSESTTSSDSVDVVLLAQWQVVVDDQGDLLDIDTSGQEVRGDQDTGRAGSELSHDDLTLSLVHVTVHGRDGELSLVQLVGEPVDLPSGVAEDDGLSNGDSLVQVAEGVELPVLLVDGDVELLDTFQGQLITLDQNPDGVTHELLGDLEDVLWHGGGQEDDLCVLGQELEDLVHLVLETTRQHLVSLVKAEHLEVVSSEGASVDHVVDSSWGTDDDLAAVLELGHVLSDVGTSNAGVAVDLHVVAQRNDDLLDLLGEFTSGGEDEGLDVLVGWVDALKNGNGEGGSLSGTGLSLGNDVVALDDGHDGTSLDGGGSLETVGVDTSEELRSKLHVVEVVDDLLPVGLDLSLGDAEWGISLRGGSCRSVFGPAMGERGCCQINSAYERRTNLMVARI